MGELRLPKAQRLGYQYLPRGVYYVIVAPYDVGYLHPRVINRRGEIVGRKPIGFQYHEIFYFRGVKNYPAPDQVLNVDLLSGGYGEPYGVRFSGGRAELGPLPPIPENLSSLLGLFPSPPELLGGNVTSVRFFLVNEPLGKPTVSVKPLGLPDDFPPPLESEPLKRLDDLPLEFLLGTRAVGIFNPEQKISAKTRGKKPVENGCARRSHMKSARRAGSESCYGLHGDYFTRRSGKKRNAARGEREFSPADCI